MASGQRNRHEFAIGNCKLTARRWASHDLPLFIFIFLVLILLHLPLLRLPYIWDEAGYYIPAARDLLLTGSLVPHSTVSNAHPPLLMAWVALLWKVIGEGPAVTRVAMLAISSFCLLGIFRLADGVANRAVATASTACVGLYSVFFMQSTLLHLDLGAAAFTVWGLHSYVSRRDISTFIWFSLAGLTKETAVLTPLALAAWEVLCYLLRRRQVSPLCLQTWNWRRSLLLLASTAPLAMWFGYHYGRTGYVFGNPEFFRYNVASTLEPVRIILAAAIRIWQLTGYLHLFPLTLAAAIAMLFPARIDPGGERQRIDVAIQLVFSVVIVAYVAAMSVIGGAELARYLLPVLPLSIILCVSTLWRRVRAWKTIIGLILCGFVFAWFVNPPYGFSFEDNLAYRDYILLHRGAEQFLQAHGAEAITLTAWPASDELTRPYLGYVRRPIKVVQVENFSYEPIIAAVESRTRFDLALVFSTKYFPPHSLLAKWPAWEKLQVRYFGFHRDLPPAAAAQILGGRILYSEARQGQWIALIEIERVLDANSKPRIPLK